MFWLRLSFWVATIADFLIAILVLIPDLPGDEYVISMGQMSAVAFSWGVLLIMADRRPMERRWVAIPTLLVVLLLGVVSLHALVAGLLPVSLLIPALGASVLVSALLLVGYLKTRKAAAG
jgi:hypothetical protein